MRDDTEGALLICADSGAWVRRVSTLRGDCDGLTISGGSSRGWAASTFLLSAPAARPSFSFRLPGVPGAAGVKKSLRAGIGPSILTSSSSSSLPSSREANQSMSGPCDVLDPRRSKGDSKSLRSCWRLATVPCRTFSLLSGAQGIPPVSAKGRLHGFSTGVSGAV